MPLQYNRESKTKRKNKGKIIKGGDGAADYGMYIWGVNQTNNPSQGNVIQPAHNPAIPTTSTQTGGGGPMEQVQQMMTPIVDNVTSQSAPSSSSSPSQTGGRKTKRKRKSKKKSKRKYR
jgi:hypothetical protein